MRNKELFNAIADHIEAKPDQYNQEVWADFVGVDTCLIETEEQAASCGTAYCVAGWATLLTEGIKYERTTYGHWVMKPTKGSHFESIAKDALGLDWDESAELFHEDWMRGCDAFEVADALRRIGDGADIERQM